MRNSVNNQIRMITTTLSVCTNNAAKTVGIGSFAGIKTSADAKRELIGQLTVIAEGTTSGVTLDTNAIKKMMVRACLKVGNALSAFATNTGNNTLRDKVTYTEPELMKMAKETVGEICEGIHGEGVTNLIAAGSFGYVQGDLDDAQTSIGLWDAASENPRQAIISKSLAIENIETLVRQIIDDLFVQMDHMIKTLLATEPDFVREYFSAREVLDLGSNSAKLRGTIKDEEDVPLVGVTVSLYDAGTQEVVGQTTSAVKGVYRISDIQAGNYDLLWTFVNYVTVRQQNQHVSAGKEIQRKIEMRPTHVDTEEVNAGQIKVLTSKVDIGRPSLVRLKNTSEATLRIYFASSTNAPWPGVGVTLAAGEEKEVTLDDIGAIQRYVLAENISNVNGSMEVTVLIEDLM